MKRKEASFLTFCPQSEIDLQPEVAAKPLHPFGEHENHLGQLFQFSRGTPSMSVDIRVGVKLNLAFPSFAARGHRACKDYSPQGGGRPEGAATTLVSLVGY